MDQPKRNLELIDASPWMAALAAGQCQAVIRGARGLRTQGCIGAFHLELLGTIAMRTPEGVADARRVLETLAIRDLYDPAPELLETGPLWLDATSWFLHREFEIRHPARSLAASASRS